MVDIKLYVVMRWFISGVIDGVSTTVFEPFPKLLRVFRAVADHPQVKAWQARSA